MLTDHLHSKPGTSLMTSAHTCQARLKRFTTYMQSMAQAREKPYLPVWRECNHSRKAGTSGFVICFSPSMSASQSLKMGLGATRGGIGGLLWHTPISLLSVPLTRLQDSPELADYLTQNPPSAWSPLGSLLHAPPLCSTPRTQL